MARRCTICSRPDAGAINVLLGEGRAVRSVAVELGLSDDALGAARGEPSRSPGVLGYGVGGRSFNRG